MIPKGYKTVITNVLTAIGTIVGVEAGALGELPANVELIIEAGMVIFATVNVVLRAFTNTPMFKKE